MVMAPVKATARFNSLIGHVVEADCIFTGFSPVSRRPRAPAAVREASASLRASRRASPASSATLSTRAASLRASLRPVGRERLLLARGVPRACARASGADVPATRPLRPQSNIRAFRGRVVFARPPLADAELQNAAQVLGNIVVIRRGGVTFFDKARRAAAAGASGIIFVNNADEVFFAECEGAPCHLPSVTIAAGAFERLADLKMLDPVSWFVEVDMAGDCARKAGSISDLLMMGVQVRLHATVVSAQGLRSADGDTDLHPFVEVSCADQCRRTRTHRAGGSMALWNQRLSFLLSAGVEHLVVRCQDEESPSSAEVIGENNNVPLDEILHSAVGTSCAVHVPLVNSYGVVAGSVYLQLSLAHASPRGRSSSASQRGAIEAVALCAENVPPPPSLGDKGNTYATLQVGGIAKRTPAHKQADSSPVWNHTMRFLMPRARPGCVPLVTLAVRLWDERDDGQGRVAIGPVAVVSLPSLSAKGDVWEGWVQMGEGVPGSTRCKVKVTCTHTPPQPSTAVGVGASTHAKVEGWKQILDADLALLYLMVFAFALALPPLRGWLFRQLLPSVLVSLACLGALALGGVLLKRRVLAPFLIKYVLGVVLGAGHYADTLVPLGKGGRGEGGKGARAAGGRPQFVSDVDLAHTLSLYDLYSFLFGSGRLRMRELTVPQLLHCHVPFAMLVPFATLVKAATVDVEVAPFTLRSRKFLVHSLIVRDFVLNIVVMRMRVGVLACWRVCVLACLRACWRVCVRVPVRVCACMRAC